MHKLLWYSPARPLKKMDKVWGGTVGIWKLLQLELGFLLTPSTEHQQGFFQVRLSVAVWKFALSLMLISIDIGE